MIDLMTYAHAEMAGASYIMVLDDETGAILPGCIEADALLGWVRQEKTETANLNIRLKFAPQTPTRLIELFLHDLFARRRTLH